MDLLLLSDNIISFDVFYEIAHLVPQPTSISFTSSLEGPMIKNITNFSGGLVFCEMVPSMYPLKFGL